MHFSHVRRTLCAQHLQRRLDEHYSDVSNTPLQILLQDGIIIGQTASVTVCNYYMINFDSITCRCCSLLPGLTDAQWTSASARHKPSLFGPPSWTSLRQHNRPLLAFLVHPCGQRSVQNKSPKNISSRDRTAHNQFTARTNELMALRLQCLRPAREAWDNTAACGEGEIKSGGTGREESLDNPAAETPLISVRGPVLRTFGNKRGVSFGIGHCIAHGPAAAAARQLHVDDGLLHAAHLPDARHRHAAHAVKRHLSPAPHSQTLPSILQLAKSAPL